jgi:hypothetical protein
MELIDNINRLLGDDLKQRRSSQGPPEDRGLLLFDVRVRGAESRAGKNRRAHFIFTSPTFTANEVTDKIRKERKEFHIPKLTANAASTAASSRFSCATS